MEFKYDKNKSRVKIKKIFFILFLGIVFILYILPIKPWHNLELKYRKELTENIIPSANKSKFFYWISIDKISKYTLQAIISAEDSRFYRHFGLDLREIWLSFQLNIREKRIVRGASTITQQLAKNIFLNRDKTLFRKFCEVLAALVLEYKLSKNEILEWYLNSIPLGNGFFGIYKASEFYFSTHPEILTISESVLLALLLPRPSFSSKDIIQRRLTAMNKNRFRVVVDEMYKNRYITYYQREKAIMTGDFGSPIERSLRD